ncbi:MAG: Low-affinity inorganic phosphate transporter 1 [Chlamydiia bacterium]|nr:Low-affinity inorganic phosphate transporter 1 [Chlamydiia bacterium]
MGIDLILIILVLLVGFYMAWNIGANDVSNAMGTSVGSGALTLGKAIIIAAVLEFCGAFFLGSNVSQTMQSGIVDPIYFEQNPSIFLYGMLAALLATSIWLQIASYFGWPVSTTHAIVGAILGFGLIIGGASTVKWAVVGSIALSWVISPAISALFSFLIFSILQKKILYAMNPVQATRRALPIYTGILFATFSISLIFGGLKNLSFKLSLVEAIGVSIGVGIIAYFITMIIINRIKIQDDFDMGNKPNHAQQMFSLNKSLKHLQRVKLVSEGDTRKEVSDILHNVRSLSETLSEKSGKHKRQSQYMIVEKMFGYLQILSACYVAFAHGANDVANAIGPVAAALDVIKNKSVHITSTVPVWLLALGGAGIVVGLATWGWRVIQTIGKKITELTPTRGFSAEFGAAVTILVASKLGLPISTTHCIVGGVLGVGLARGISALNLRTLRDIALSWVITIPSSAIVCIIIFYIIKAIFTNV